MAAPIYFLTLAGKTSLFKLADLFPECQLYREQQPRLDPLVCLRDNGCHVGHNCMATLVKRLHRIFDEVLPQTNLILLYYRKLSDGKIGAGVFWRDFREPRVIGVNPRSWERVKLRSQTFQFFPEDNFFL